MACGDLSSAVPSARGELGQLSSALIDLRDQMRQTGRQDSSPSRSDLLAVLDGVGDAMFLVEGGSVASANDAASTLFETPVRRMGRSRPGRSRAAGVTCSCFERAACRAPGGTQIGATVVRDVGPDPKGRWYRVSCVPLPGVHREPAERRLVTIADTTDRMRLDRMRTDFVANASHELKTPTCGHTAAGGERTQQPPPMARRDRRGVPGSDRERGREDVQTRRGPARPVAPRVRTRARGGHRRPAGRRPIARFTHERGPKEGARACGGLLAGRRPRRIRAHRLDRPGSRTRQPSRQRVRSPRTAG